MDLWQLGYTETEAEALEQARADRPEDALYAARVVRDQNLIYTLAGAKETEAVLAGRLKHEARRGGGRAELPVVGDWVAVAPQPNGPHVIQRVLPRRSRLARRANAGGGTDDFGGREAEQVLAANVDHVFLVSALDGGRNFNLRRIERYLTLARAGGVEPVLILNKADCCDDAPDCVAETHAVAPDVPTYAISALDGHGMEDLHHYCVAGQTVALLGPSGVGKSTIINRLLGEERQATGEIREADRRGRHTTVRRELLFLPDGGMLIDTPGLRDIQLWADEEALEENFADLQELAAACRFSNCRHNTEPGCAIQAAIDREELDALRVENYLRQLEEVQNRAERQARSPGHDGPAARRLSKIKRRFLKELE